MNKIKVLMIAMLASAFVFTGCSDDEEEDPSGPSMTVTPTEFTGWGGDTLTIDYAISSNEEITSLTVTPNTTELTSYTFDQSTLNGQFSATGTIEYILPDGSNWDDGDSFDIVFVAQDEDGGAEFPTSKTVTVTYDEPITSTPFDEEHTGEIWNIQGLEFGAWDLVANVGLSVSASDDDKDMINTTTSQNPEIFVSGWTANNGTNFVDVSAAGIAYEDMDQEVVASAYAAGTAVTTVSDVEAGDIYIANLRGTGDYAVIRIDNVVITTTDNNDKIEFTYKK